MQTMNARKALTPWIWVSAVIGGLILSYLLMVIAVQLTSGTPVEKLFFPLIVTTLAWPLCSLWIFHSTTQKVAILKTLWGIGLSSITILILSLVVNYAT